MYNIATGFSMDINDLQGHFTIVVPYSGNLLREEIFTNLAILLSEEIFIIFDFTNKPKLATHYSGAASPFVRLMKILFAQSIHNMIQTSIKIDIS